MPHRPAAVVDVPQVVADWLCSFGVVKAGAPVLDARGQSIVQLRAGDWADVQNGKHVGAILAAVFVEHGQPNPVPRMQDGDDPAVRLHNWNALVPHLATFGVNFPPDVKALIVAGDMSTLISQLHELRTRAGVGHGGAASDPWANAPQDTARAASHLRTNTDRAELASSTGFQVVGLYATMVACLLTIFIQQDCGHTTCVTAAGVTTCVTQRQPCSFTENLTVNTGFGKLVVAFNFITLAVFLIGNAVFFFREKWIITHFDTDPDLPIDNLTYEVKLYPRFRAVLGRFNVAAAWLSSLMVLLLAVNFVLSAIQILKFRYAGKASVIGLLSNTGLVASKVVNWNAVARRSRAQDAAVSLFDLRNRGMNTVSAERKFQQGEYVPDAAAT